MHLRSVRGLSSSVILLATVAALGVGLTSAIAISEVLDTSQIVRIVVAVATG
jgi:hypothetical protein